MNTTSVAEKSSRLFNNNLMERLTHVHHRTPFFVYVPVLVGVLLYAIFQTTLPVYTVPFLAFAGILEWTLTEYGLHRYVFHYEPTSEAGKRAIYMFHGVHHDFPNEADRLVMPPVASIPTAALILVAHYLIFGKAGLPIFSGFLMGYLYYEHVHYSVHNAKEKLAWTEKQRKEHLLHHFRDHNIRFGVTTRLWDYVFRTAK